MPEDDVETLRLSLSGLLCQRRRDGRWRWVNPAHYHDEEAGRFEDDPEEWIPADLPVPRGGRGKWPPGLHDEASWWLLYGDGMDAPVSVTLADGRTPPILTFGPLWICEWVSKWQPAQVAVGSDSYGVFRYVPGHVRRMIGAEETH